MKARDYLVEQGLAKSGRGKFSNAAKEHLHAAIATGMKFSDYGEEQVSEEIGYDMPAMTWPNGTARYRETKAKLSMKEACNDCGVSLYWCECRSPRVLGREVVISPN